MINTKDFIRIPCCNMSKGKRALVYGVGINDSDYHTHSEGAICPFYRTWMGILKRCYSETYQALRPNYIGCSIDKRWIKYSDFLEWMESQDWQGKEIDKDILSPGNKIYGPDFCIFVTRIINNSIKSKSNKLSTLPTGVSFKAKVKPYVASCRGKYIGSFYTESEASNAYKKAKSNYIKEIAETCLPDKRLYDALIVHSELILKL